MNKGKQVDFADFDPTINCHGNRVCKLGNLDASLSAGERLYWYIACDAVY